MMHRRILLSVILAFISLVAPAAEDPARPDAADFATTLARARQLAAEGSWALARDAFVQAQPLAPDAANRDWCELGLVDATWRSEIGPANNRPSPEWVERHRVGLDRLLEPYARGRERDGFWQAVMTSRAALNARIWPQKAAWSDRLEILDYIGRQSPSRAGAAAHVAFLQRSLGNEMDFVPDEFASRLFDHLALARRIAPDAGDRAWAFLRSVKFDERDQAGTPADRAARWAEALAAARGTIWETRVQAEEFLFRVHTGWSPGSAPDTPADLPARLSELVALRTQLKAAAASTYPAKLVTDLDALEKSWRGPLLALAMPAQFSSAETPKFRYCAVGYSRLTVELYRHTLESWIDRPTDVQELVRAGIVPNPGTAPSAQSLTKLRASAERLDQRSFALDGADVQRWHSDVGELSARAPGFYTVLLAGEGPSGPEVCLYHFMISDVQGTMMMTTGRPATVFLRDATTQQPLAGRRLRGVLRDYDKQSEPFTVTTDRAGRAELPALKIVGDRYVQTHLAALLDEQPVDCPVFGMAATLTSLIGEVIFDRPIYRPGEMVHWKLVVRDRRNGRFVVPDEKLLFSIVLRETETPLTKDQEIALNAFGSAHGELVIPASARPDDAVFTLRRPGKSEDEDDAKFVGAFRVDNFVPPALVTAVVAISGGDSMRPGQELVMRVSAKYFSGGPAAGAPVTCRFTASPNYHVSPDSPLARSFETWKQSLDQALQRATTNGAGEAEFRLSLPSALPDPVNLRVVANLTPDGGQAVEDDTNVTITAAGATMDAEGWRQIRPVRPGDTVDFAGRVRDGQREPRPFEGKAQLVEKKWLEVWLDPAGRIVSGADLLAVRSSLGLQPTRNLPNPWRRLHAGYTEDPVATSKVAAGTDGAVHARFTIPSAGLFQLRLLRGSVPVSADDAEGLSVLAVDDRTTTLMLPPGESRVLSPSALADDQPLRVLVVLPEGHRAGIIAVDGENEMVAQRFDLTARAGWVSVDRLPRFAGHGEVRITAFGSEADSLTARGSFAVINSRDRLQLEVQPATAELRPGATSAASVKVSDSQGRPVAAELAVFASDEAVNRLWQTADGTDAPRFSRYDAALTTFFSNFGGAVESGKVAPLRDPRPGAFLNPSMPTARGDDDLIELIPFSLTAVSGYAYGSASTLAGSRTGAAGQMLRVVQFADTPASASPAISIRRRFSSTAFWEPEVKTDAKGEARVAFAYPDNLTQWRFTAYAVGPDGQTFGQAHALTRTSLPFQARLQTPRFLVAGDTAALSAVLVNRARQPLTASADLTAGGAIELLAAELKHRDGLAVSPEGETHVAWQTRATRAGEATLELTARADAEGDGMQLALPVLENGIQQATAASGRLAPDATTLALTLPLPAPLDPARTEAHLLLSPSHASALLDALPYLIDYPYGCVEQTMSRFLPAVVVKKALVDLGFDAAAVDRRIVARPTTTVADRRKSAGFGKLDDVIEQSLARLRDAQLGNGGYGWWPGQGTSDPWMTAYVGWGLAVARDAGLSVSENLLSTQALLGACETLDASDENLAWSLAALTRMAALQPANEREKSLAATRGAFARAFAERDRLSPSARACLASAAVALGTADQRAVLLRNLENGAERVRAADLGDTVHWGRSTGYWRAMDGAVESTALTLLALIEADPHHPLIEPAVNWLVLNRRSAQWRSTRETAFAVFALTRALVVRGEAQPDAEVELTLNDRVVQRIKLTRETLLAGAADLVLDPAQLRPGDNRLALRRVAGQTPVYAVALNSSWARGDAVKPASHLVEVARGFERQKEQPTLAGVLRIDTEPLPPGGMVAAGEQVKARVTLTVPNELEYLMVEVPKPAGCEPLNPLSGWDAQLVRVEPGALADSRGRSIYREERDEKSVFFLDHLTVGTWEIRFGLRATTPGDFQALPVKTQAMYAPEIRANSDARRVRIESASP